MLALAAFGALKLMYTVIKQVIKVTARVIVYFGLYIPFFYFIVGAVFVGLGYFRFEVLTIDAILFYVGMALCLACSVLITIRTYAQKPVSSVAEGVREDISRAKRYGRKNTGNAEKDDPLLFVYHSVDHPELFIEEHEYSFVVYYDDGVNPLKKLRVEPKEQR